jgi:hypothetical protein
MGAEMGRGGGECGGASASDHSLQQMVGLHAQTTVSTAMLDCDRA